MKLTTLSVLVSVALFGLVGCASKGSGSETRSVNKTANKTVSYPTITYNPHPKTTVTAHTIALNDKKAMGITYVLRPTGEFAKQIQKAFENTNKLRAEKGVKPLKLDDGLSAYAQMRASEAVLQFNHARLGDTGVFEPFTDWSLLGENLAAGGSSADQTVLQQWRNSEGHYGNMVNPAFQTIGIGLVYVPDSPYKYYWVQFFATEGTKTTYQFMDNAQTKNPKPLEQLIVNGTTVPLPKAQSGTWQAVNANGHTGWVNGYQHSRFGSVGKGNTQTHLFYQGARTDDTAIPKSGKVTYNGHALIIKNSTANTNAQSRFTADFGTRKLNGTIHQNNQTLYTLSADINGGAFASKAGASVETQGAFFGQNAEELGGTFKDSKTDTKGVFGAKK